ncbi:ABC transporter permease subunit [Pelistega sp. NLN82]|uniref:ABC transporter permease subunit n=1 Tax=Pelistega ratti TaxID=2652177 RepID=A0A6L9Y5T7_9BURK|nr:ABC transporter permease subunit [Pelistega ratti]NEN75840.1 ABC transporter permease subunit [Pelistega ratti]
MFLFLLKRVVALIPTLLGVTLLTFLLLHLIPGDPVQIMMGERSNDPEIYASIVKRLGLDQPLYIQYWEYLKGLLQGDLGKSFVTNTSVWEEFKALFPATLELGIMALLFGSVFGILLGVLAAVKRGSIFDHGVMGLSLTGYSMPIFWWGLMLIMLFSSVLGWTPVSGRISLFYDIEPHTGFMLIDSLIAQWEDPEFNQGAFLSALHHLILPTIVLGTIPLAVISRMTRSSMLEVMGEDYVRTAKAKGLSPRRVIFIHTLRNALIAVVTVIGLQIGVLIGGAVLTETIFSWPGIGKWLVDSIFRRDYPVVQNGLLIVATLVILVNLLVDVVYGLVNPRIRHAR